LNSEKDRKTLHFSAKVKTVAFLPFMTLCMEFATSHPKCSTKLLKECRGRARLRLRLREREREVGQV